MELKTLFACALVNIWIYLRHFLHEVDCCFKPLQQTNGARTAQVIVAKGKQLGVFCCCFFFLLDTNDML
jgi:hypothetical protein